MIKQDALAARKEKLVQHTRQLTQHFMSRSNQTVLHVTRTSSQAYLLLRKFKVFVQNLANYPKIAYAPLLMFACANYGYLSVEQSSVPYEAPIQAISEEKPINDFKSFTKWILDGVTSVIVEIIGSNDVKKQGLSYLERMFKNKQVHESLIILLKGGVKDTRFVEDSKIFGKDWISKAITA